MALTRWPASTSAATSRRPMKPVAPVTSTVSPSSVIGQILGTPRQVPDPDPGLVAITWCYVSGSPDAVGPEQVHADLHGRTSGTGYVATGHRRCSRRGRGGL